MYTAPPRLGVGPTTLGLLLLLLLLASSFPDCADAVNGVGASSSSPLPRVYFPNMSCTGILPVCRRGEAEMAVVCGHGLDHGGDDQDDGGQEDGANACANKTVCRPNVMGRPTVILDAQNWNSAHLNSLVLQVLLGEQMQTPVEFADHRFDAKSTGSLDFWSWPAGGSSFADEGGPEAYPWDALVEGDKEFSCANATKNGRRCIHIMTEVWSNQLRMMSTTYGEHTTNVGGVGFAADIGAFTNTMTKDAFSGLSHRQLNDPNVARYIGSPVDYTTYCTTYRAKEADYDTSTCKFLHAVNTTWLETAGLSTSFFIGPGAFPAAAEKAALAWGATDMPPNTKTTAVYAGKLEPRADGKVHIVDPPCSWNSWFDVQFPESHVEQASYGKMLSLFDMTSYNMARVNRTKPVSQWKDDPHFLPIIIWWWAPDAVMNKHVYKADPYPWKFEKVRAPSWNEQCDRERLAVYKPLREKYCNKTTMTMDYPVDWKAQCGASCVASRCTERPEFPIKVTTLSFAKHAPDADRVVKRLQLNTETQDMWQGSIYHDESLRSRHPDPNFKIRHVVCDWIKANKDQGARWARWIPDTVKNIGCRKNTDEQVCSGHGTCQTAGASAGTTSAGNVAVTGGETSGNCVCQSEFEGRLCSIPVDPRNAERNQISPALRSLIYAMAIIGVASCFFVAAWTAMFRRHPVVSKSQPVFLFTVILGCAISMSSLFAFAVDDTGVDEASIAASRAKGEIPGVDLACMAQPWLYCIGVAISFSSLILKTWRIKALLSGSLQQSSKQHANIKIGKLLRWTLLLVTVESIILLAWTATAPLVWKRTVQERDTNGFATNSVGFCSMSSGNSMPFLLVLGAIQLGCYIYGNIVMYQARKVDTLFSEGKYITMCMVSNIQVRTAVSVFVS